MGIQEQLRSVETALPEGAGSHRPDGGVCVAKSSLDGGQQVRQVVRQLGARDILQQLLQAVAHALPSRRRLRLHPLLSAAFVHTNSVAAYISHMLKCPALHLTCNPLLPTPPCRSHSKPRRCQHVASLQSTYASRGPLQGRSSCTLGRSCRSPSTLHVDPRYRTFLCVP